MAAQDVIEAARTGSRALPTNDDIRQLMAAHDWTKTGLGTLDRWPLALRAVIDLILQTNVPMAVLWGEAGLLLYNAGYAALSGVRHPGIFGRPVAESWPEVADFNANVLQSCLAGQSLAYRNLSMVLDRDGQPQPAWFNLDYSPIPGCGGAPAGVLAVCIDTTEQVHAQERLRIAQEAGRVGTFEWYPDSGKLDVSDEYRRIWGLEPELAVTDGALLARIEQEDRHLAGPNRREAINPLSYAEYRVRHGITGEERWLARRGEVVPSQTGETMRYVGVVFDVTDRRRAEEALRSSEARQRFLLALGDRMRSLVDPEDVMAAAAEMLGRHLRAGRVGYGEIGGTPAIVQVWRDWTDGEMASFAGRHLLDSFGSLVVEPLREGSILVIDDAQADLRVARSNAGDTFAAVSVRSAIAVPLVKAERLAAVLYVHANVPRDWSPDEVALVADVADRTWEAVDRARITRELLDLASTLEQRVSLEVRRRGEAEEQLRHAVKMEALGQLTGGLAHDFNNLLTGIIGGLDVIRRRIAQGRTESLDRYIELTHASARKAATLTHRLLAFSRRQSLDTRAVDVNRVAASMEELIRRTIGENIALRVELSPDLPPARTDAHQLENAVLNLAINARDAMPTGGELVLETDTRPGPLDPDPGGGDWVILRVRDSGTGMSETVLARAFDPFFTTKPIGAGTGLGLSMVYGFVAQSNGQIRITSREGAGTTVSIALPRDPGPVVEDEAEAPQPGRGAGESILLVEDDPGVRTLAADVLREAGYHITVALDAEAALSILRSPDTIDLLLTDVGLPGLNGRQLAEIARQRRPDLKVLFMTGYAEKAADRTSFLDAGMAMIAKPFDVDALTAKVRETLGPRVLPARVRADLF